MPRKKSDDPAVKKSISMPQSLFGKMEKRMDELGFRSESAYIQLLVRNDCVKGGTPEIALIEKPVRPVKRRR